MPTVNELQSIVDYSGIYPSINSIFINTDLGFYWTSTRLTEPGRAIAVGFDSPAGFTYGLSESNQYSVRCVRSAKSSRRNSNFKENGDGTVTDLARGLTWQKTDGDNAKTFNQSLVYCWTLTLGGKKDWHLPNIKELQSLVDHRVSYPAISESFFQLQVGCHFFGLEQLTLEIPIVFILLCFQSVPQ